MKGLLFQASGEGIDESYLENEKAAHVVVCCDVCSPFSEHLKQNVLSQAKSLIKDLLATAHAITEGEIRKSIHKVNEQLRAQYKKDKKRIALSMTILAEDADTHDLIMASCGDMHLCQSLESGLKKIYPSKETRSYISERERLKELHQAMIRNAAPFVQVMRLKFSESKYLGVIPQALYHQIEAHELNSAIAKPHDPEFGIEAIMSQNDSDNGNLQLAILLNAGQEEEMEMSETKPPESEPAEASTKLPQGLYTDTSKKKAPQKTLTLALIICTIMVAAGFTLYKLSSKPAPSAPSVQESVADQNSEDVDELKNENTLQSQRIRLLAEEINSIKQDIQSDIVEDQEEITDLKEAIEQKDLAISKMQENMENQTVAGLEEAQAAREELASQLDETTTRYNEQKQTLDEVEKSLNEEVQKSQFLRDSLATEITKREDQEKSLSLLQEETDKWKSLYESEKQGRKALHSFNMQKHLETNPYLKSSSALPPLSTENLVRWGEEKQELESRVATLSEKHDELVVENQVLYQRLEDLDSSTKQAPNAGVTPDHSIALEELKAENEDLRLKLTLATEELGKKPTKAQMSASYLQASNDALQGELQRIKESNVALSRELQSMKRALGSLQQESVALERSISPESSGSAQKHIVQRGETLSEISMTYFGTSKRWRDILEANKDKIHSSNVIQVGMELTIPQN